jgi:hypothetical protein
MLLWGRRMTYNAAMASGAALVGSFLLGADLVVKGTLRLAATNSDQDDFVKNLTTFRAEIRAALCTSVPKAFGLVTGLVAAA